MLIALPAALVIAALGLERLLEVFALNAPGRQAARAVVLTAVLLAELVLNTRTYFVDFAAQCPLWRRPTDALCLVPGQLSAPA